MFLGYDDFVVETDQVLSAHALPRLLETLLEQSRITKLLEMKRRLVAALESASLGATNSHVMSSEN